VSLPSSIQEQFVLARATGSGFAQEMAAGQHLLNADEPCSAGGTQTGPAPYQLRLAAFGASTAMTVTMYAKRKNLPLDGIVVRLRHSKIPAEDCFGCWTEAGSLDRLDYEIELTGSLTPNERLSLFEVGDKYPVHRTLTSEINIRSTLK
jgi:putative redox protein